MSEKNLNAIIRLVESLLEMAKARPIAKARAEAARERKKC